MSMAELERMADFADDMPFCPAKLMPAVPVPVPDSDLPAMPEPRPWAYRVCGMPGGGHDLTR